MKLELVEVEWLDHCAGESTWYTPDDLRALGPSKCRTVGFVYQEDDTCLRLVHTIPAEGEESDEYGVAVVIVKSCIVKRRTLRDCR